MTLDPTTRYWLGWIVMGVVFLAAVRLFVVNPIVSELRKFNAAIASVRSDRQP